MLWGWGPSDRKKKIDTQCFPCLNFYWYNVHVHSLLSLVKDLSSEARHEIEKGSDHFNKVDGMGYCGCQWCHGNWPMSLQGHSTIFRRLWHSEKVPDVRNKANTAPLFHKGKEKTLRSKRIVILTLGFRTEVGVKSPGSYSQTHRGLQSEWEQPAWIYQGQPMPDWHQKD